MSKWVTPTKYYVSFPHGIYDTSVIKEYRSIIRGPESFYLSYKDQTVRDDLFLGFTFAPQDWKKFKWNIKDNCTGGNRLIPAHERWSSRHFSLAKIFNLSDIVIDNRLEVENYYSLKTWESFQDYYKSGIKIPRPSKQFMKPYKFTNCLTY